MSNYVDIKAVTGGDSRLVKQDLKFRTGNFVWRVSFNIPLNPATVNNQNLTLVASTGNPVSTKIGYNSTDNTIEVSPLEPYTPGETYTLVVGRNVESKGGQKLKNEIRIDFAI